MDSIQITGNKSEFKNFITDPIILEPNSKICLNKASFAIPVWTQKYITVPLLTQAPVDERAFVMFYVDINGVSESITWREFYTAWNVENTAENNLEFVTEDDFFDGTYQFFINNFVNYFDSTTGIKSQKVNFLRTLAKAINTKFGFFRVVVNNNSFKKQEGINLNKIFDPIATSGQLTISGTQYGVYATNVEMVNVSLTSYYNPEEVFKSTPTSTTDATKMTFFNSRFQGDDVDFNYTGVGAAAPEAFAVFKSTGSNGYKISPNGGYWRFRVDISNAPAILSCGLMFMDEETKYTGGTSQINYNDIMVGFEFNNGGAGYESLRIFDGVSRDNTGAFANNTYPNGNFFEYDDDVDLFAIQVVRAGEPHPNAYKYIVNFYQGDINDFNDDMDNMDLLYSSNFVINNPSLNIVPIITCSQTGGSAAGGCKIRDNHIVERSQQDIALGQTESIDESNLFQITPSLLNNVNEEYLSESGIDFFNGLGFFADDTNQVSLSSERDPLVKTLTQPIGSVEKRYFIGIDKISNVFRDNNPQIETLPGSLYIPRQIEVSMINLSHTPNVGSYIEGDIQYNENDINKVVSYINTDADYFNAENNTHLEFVYEAFNLVFRKLNNRDKLPLNSFNIKIGYKDFFDNVEKKINQLIGVLKLEFLFSSD